MKNFISAGTTIEYVSGATYAGGEPVFLNGIVGINTYDVVSGETGILQIGGVYEVEKAAEDQARGDLLYWDASTKKAQKTATAYLLGICETAALTAVNFVDVYLPLPGALKAVGTTAAEVRDLLETLTTTSRLTADAVKSGTTNVMITATKETGYDSWKAKETAYDTFKGKEAGYDTWKAKETAYDTFQGKEAGYDTWKAKEGGYDTFKAKEAAYDADVLKIVESEHTFNLASSNVWADAVPAEALLVSVKYINVTEITVTTAVNYKINITGGATADLVPAGILLTKNVKQVKGLAQVVTASAGAINLTPDAGTLDTGTVKMMIRYIAPQVTYTDIP